MTNTKDREAEAPRVLGVESTSLEAINQAWFQYQIERMGQPLDTHQVAFVAGYLKGAHSAIPAPSPEPQAELKPTTAELIETLLSALGSCRSPVLPKATAALSELERRLQPKDGR